MYFEFITLGGWLVSFAIMILWIVIPRRGVKKLIDESEGRR